MPLYGVNQSGFNPAPNQGLNLTAVQPGDSFTLFNAETVTAPQASVAFSRAAGPANSDGGTTFSISFASAPTAVVQIQAANQDLDSEYVTVYTSSNTQHDAYTDVGRSAFYRARVLSQSAGGAITVIAQR